MGVTTTYPDYGEMAMRKGYEAARAARATVADLPATAPVDLTEQLGAPAGPAKNVAHFWGRGWWQYVCETL